jgi:hypothetical protein
MPALLLAAEECGIDILKLQESWEAFRGRICLADKVVSADPFVR